MPYIEDQKSLYKHAVDNHYIIPACHISGISTLKALLQGAEEADSPIMIQIGVVTREIFSPLPKFIHYFKELCDEYSIPILLNHDHISSVEDCFWAIDNDFLSVMFDGSRLPFEQNVAKTRQVVEYAHVHNVWVEAELGNIPGFEDLVFSAQTVYTDPEMAKEFIARTGCDSLAVAVGTAHGGVKAEKTLEIDFDLLGRIKQTIGDTPLVLHGAASLPAPFIDKVNQFGGSAEYLKMCLEETIEKTRNYGVAKANMDVDNMLVITGAIREHFMEKPENYNHIKYLKIASDALKEEVKRKISQVTKSGGYGSKYINKYK